MILPTEIVYNEVIVPGKLLSDIWRSELRTTTAEVRCQNTINITASTASSILSRIGYYCNPFILNCGMIERRCFDWYIEGLNACFEKTIVELER